MLDLLFYPIMAGAILLPAIWFLRRQHEFLEALALGAGFGVLFWGVLGLVRFFLILPASRPRLVGLVSLGLCLGAGLLLAICALRPATPFADATVPGSRSRPSGRLLLAVLAVATLSLGVETSLPNYDLPARYYDWFMHFDLARVYQTATTAGLGRHWLESTVTTRTPLYNLLGSVALAFLGDRFTVFQVLTAAVAWLWILPFALLARRLVPAWAVTITALAALSPLVLHTHMYAWPKGLVTFFALLALERFLALREAPSERVRSISIQLGLFSAATVMSHAGFIGFPLALFALYGWDVLRRRRHWAGLAMASASALLVAIPWYAWGITQYGLHAAVFGYPRTPYPSILRWAFDRFLILPTSFWPLSFPLDRYVLQPVETYLLAFIGTATGLLGLLFLLRAMAQNLKARTRVQAGSAEMPLLWFAGIGILVADLLLDSVVTNNAGNLCLPGLLALLLLAVRANPLTRFFVVAALIETTLFEAAVLVWVWTPAGRGRPNAQLAQLHHLRFLGQDLLPVGLLLVVMGIGLAVASLWPRLRKNAELGVRPEAVAA